MTMAPNFDNGNNLRQRSVTKEIISIAIAVAFMAFALAVIFNWNDTKYKVSDFIYEHTTTNERELTILHTTFNEVTLEDCTHFEIPRDTKVTVPDGCTISGDIIIVTSNGNDVAMYDHVANTGLTITCVTGCTVKAPFGASISDKSSTDIGDEMLLDGCGQPTGCYMVTIISFDQDALEEGSLDFAQVTEITD